MANKKKTNLLLNWFNGKLLKVSSYDNYIGRKGTTLGGSAKSNIDQQLKNDKEKIKKSLKEAEKLLHRKIKIF